MDDRHRHVREDRSPPSQPIHAGIETAGHLWTPWRMAYVAGGTREHGCIFCNRLKSEDDARNLLLLRQDRSFAILNLYPYNTGHSMVVPNRHIDSPERLDDDTSIEMTRLARSVLIATRRALHCEGFNVGLNIGSMAGAGVAEHMHQHIVPRWVGDANFMPIVGGTTVMPETLAATYAKIRVELLREVTSIDRCALLCFDVAGSSVLLDIGQDRPALPTIPLEDGSPAWRTALETLDRLGMSGELIGWAAETRAAAGRRPGLMFVTQSTSPLDSSVRMARIDDALTMPLAPADAATIQMHRPAISGNDRNADTPQE
jgi:ATP adenylyltransferase